MLAEMLKPLSADGTVDDAVVAAERHSHHLLLTIAATNQLWRQQLHIDVKKIVFMYQVTSLHGSIY